MFLTAFPGFVCLCSRSASFPIFLQLCPRYDEGGSQDLFHICLPSFKSVYHVCYPKEHGLGTLCASGDTL